MTKGGVFSCRFNNNDAVFGFFRHTGELLQKNGQAVIFLAKATVDLVQKITPRPP
jgi:hypothetical protein